MIDFEEEEKEITESEAPVVPPGELPIVPLRVFLACSRMRWDQTAGFTRYAKIENLSPRSISDWRLAFEAFNSRPVR